MKRGHLRPNRPCEARQAPASPVSTSSLHKKSAHQGTSCRQIWSKEHLENGAVVTPPERDPDHDTLAECRAGNKQAFNELILRHKDRLYTVAVHLLGDSGEAEDVTQDTFLKAYEKLAEFRGDARFSTWLYRICYNLCLNHLTRKRVDRQEGVFPETLPDGKERFFDQMLVKEQQDLVSHAIAQLPVEFREVVLLYYTGQLSYEEIASLLELPVGTVRSRLHRGREQLKDLLRPYLQEDR
ncbi:MAG: RNA polymerase sigma factor [Candidatus Binatia bacterium]